MMPAMQPFFDMIIFTMFARFMLNDMMHATGLLEDSSREELAQKRYQQMKRYLHTTEDMRNIASGTGIIPLYHGAPATFANLLTKEGPNIPYSVEDVARSVAKLYDIPWMEFREYAHRRHEVVNRLSTAPVMIAARWAWTFPYGEVLTDLNSHARLVAEARNLARVSGKSLEDSYEDVHKHAILVAKQTGQRYSIDSAPDVLGLADELGSYRGTGSIVQVHVDGRAIPEHARISAKMYLDELREGEISERAMLAYWNYQYVDIRVPPSSVRSARVVIENMEPWEQDMVEGIISKETADL